METSTDPIADSQAHHSTPGSMLAPDLGFEQIKRVAISSNSVASSAFMEAILRNFVFLQNFAAPEILTFKLVCKSWKAWFVHNAATTMGHARRQDDTRDWYFPLFGNLEEPNWLAGMWHGNARHSSTSKLSNFALILKPGIKDLVDSAGGLLVFEMGTSLVVTNPLTKLSKELPECDSCPVPQFPYCSAQQLLMVDEVTNTYKLILFWCSQSELAQSKLAVYDPRSNKWGKVLKIQLAVQPFFGSWTDPPVYKDKRIYSAICKRGRLYVGDVRARTDIEASMNPQLAGVIRLFEVDIVTGEGKLCNEFPLCKVHVPLLISGICCNLELVECMGHLYAVIPVRYVPLQFHIIKLEGDVGAHGVLPTEALKNNIDLRALINQKRIRSRDNFFSCMAKGSVIWVTANDYLLQYDVMSRKCFTEVIDIPQGKHTFGLAYRASFHMKP